MLFCGVAYVIFNMITLHSLFFYYFVFYEFESLEVLHVKPNGWQIFLEIIWSI